MNIKNVFKSYLGEINILTGVAIFFSNLFNFTHRSKGGLLPPLPGTEDNWLYYYEDSTRFYITLGAILIILGIFILRNKK